MEQEKHNKNYLLTLERDQARKLSVIAAINERTKAGLIREAIDIIIEKYSIKEDDANEIRKSEMV